VRKIIKTLKTVSNLPKSGRHRRFTPRSGCAMFSGTAKPDSCCMCQPLQASVSMLNVKVHDSMIRKKLNKYGSFGRNARGSLLLSKRNKAA